MERKENFYEWSSSIGMIEEIEMSEEIGIFLEYDLYFRFCKMLDDADT
jgi:hypothetical protein